MSNKQIVTKEDIIKDAVPEVDDQVLEKLVEEYELSEKEDADDLDEEDEAVEEVKITKDDKVVKKHEEMAENEIKITSKGLIKNYLGYAFRILNKTNHRNLKIRATGNAIVKALILIELVKRRVPELHQLNKIYSMELKSTKEPKIQDDKIPGDNEGDDKERIRRVAAMDTILSKDILDKNQPGYQEPLPKEEMIQIVKEIKKPQVQQTIQGKEKTQKRVQKRYNDFEDDKEQKPLGENKDKKQNENEENKKPEKRGEKNEKQKYQQKRPQTVHRPRGGPKLEHFEVEQQPKQPQKPAQKEKTKDQIKDQPKDTKEQPKQKAEKKKKSYRNKSEEKQKIKFDEPKQKYEEQKRDHKKGEQKEDFKKQKEDFKKKNEDYKKQNKEEAKKQVGQQHRHRKRQGSHNSDDRAIPQKEFMYASQQFYGRRGGREQFDNRPPYYQEYPHPEEQYHKQRQQENYPRFQYSHDDFYAIDKPIYHRRRGGKEYYNDRPQYIEPHQMYPPPMVRFQGEGYYQDRFEQVPYGQRVAYYEQNDRQQRQFQPENEGRQQRQFQPENEGMMQGQRGGFHGGMRGEPPGGRGGYYPMELRQSRGQLKHEFVQRGEDWINVPARDREQMNQMHPADFIPKGQRAEALRGMRGMPRGMRGGMVQREQQPREHQDFVKQQHQDFARQPRDQKYENERKNPEDQRGHQIHQKRRGGEPDNTQGEGKRGGRIYN